MTLNMFLGQPCCICIKEDNFGLKGSETDVTGIPLRHMPPLAVFDDELPPDILPTWVLPGLKAVGKHACSGLF